jgi:phage tail sheath gpL-like
MTNAEIATAIVAAVNANSNLPVTASGSSFPVTLTAKNLGLCGNDLDCRINYYGSKNQEFTPAGLTVTISAFTSGAENPSLTAPLASLGSIPFNLIAAPYVDAESYGSMETFLSDADGRWNYTEALYGHYFTVANNSAGSLQTLGTDINDQHITVMGIDSPPTPPFYIAAGLAGQAATSLQADPGQPLNTLILSGCLPPSQGDQWTISEQQTLLTAGIGTLVADTANNLRIGRPVTTYTTNSFGQPDNSYQNAEFMYCIMFTITYFAANLSSTYARCKLAADGTRVPTGSNIVTPSVIQGTLVNLYGNLCDLAICQNFTNFTQNVTVVIDPLNPNMVDCSLPATMISQLETTRLALQLVL